MDEKKKRKRGSYITLLKKRAEADVFEVLIGEGVMLNTLADVKKWMIANDIKGTVYMARIAKDTITRSVKTITSFE